MKKNFEIKATGKSKGEWIFHGEFQETVDYLSDHKRILEFNPFCRQVEKTGIDNIYKWHFRVTDPQNNPFDVIFFIEENQELMVAVCMIKDMPALVIFLITFSGMILNAGYSVNLTLIFRSKSTQVCAFL